MLDVRQHKDTAIATRSNLAQSVIGTVGAVVLRGIDVAHDLQVAWLPPVGVFQFVARRNCQTKAVVAIVGFVGPRNPHGKNRPKYGYHLLNRQFSQVLDYGVTVHNKLRPSCLTEGTAVAARAEGKKD